MMINKLRCVVAVLLIIAFKGMGSASLGGAYVSDSDTIALYHLNDSTGTSVTDATTNGYDGVLFNTYNEWISPAKYQGGLKIQSNPGGFNVDLSFTGKNFTVEGWFKPSAVNETQYLFIGKGSSGENIFYLRQQVVSQVPTLVCGIYDTGTSSWHEIFGGSISVDTWYHVALTVSNSGDSDDTSSNIIKMCLYQNNSLKNSGIYDFTTLPGTVTDLKVGRGMWDDINYYFTGAMDEIRISKTPRYSFTVPVNSPVNLIDNANFETVSTNPAFPGGWSKYVISGSATHSWDTSNYVSANHSAKTIVNTAGQAYWEQLVTEIDDSTNYRMRAHAYISNGSSGSHAIEICWQNSNNTILRTDRYTSSIANQWTEVIEENIVPPTGTTQASIRLRSNLPGTYYFDDVVLEREDNNLHMVNEKFPLGICYLPNVHLLRNGDFELQGNSNMPLGWTQLFSTGAVNQTWDTGRYVSGTHSLKSVVTIDGQSDWRQYVYNIDPDLDYKLSGSVYASNVATGSHQIAVQWLNSSGTYLGQSALSATTANQWVQLSQGSLVPPTGTTHAVVVLRTYKTGTYNFDDISFDVDCTDEDICDDIKDAGFNFLNLLSNDADGLTACGNAGLKASIYNVFSIMYLPDGSNPSGLISQINAKESNSAVALWCAVDEPNIHAQTADGVINAYDTLVDTDDYFNSAPHKVWLTFAPRGLTDSAHNAKNFTLLRSYNPGADIVSMDVYPVPETCGFSNLPNQTISSVGDYVDILYNQIANWENATTQYNNQGKPIWMYLQGYGKDDVWNSSYNPYTSHGIELQWYDVGHNFLGISRLPALSDGLWHYRFLQNITPPAGATDVYVVLRAYASGTYYFDNIDFREVGSSNMLLNPNFETSNGNMPANWGTAYLVPHGSVDFIWDNSEYVSSSHSAKIVMSNSAYFYGQADWRQGPFAISDTKKYALGGNVLSQRTPTWKQTRFMAYNSIIHGARGIVYYGQEHIPVTSVLWNDMKDLATELDGLSTALISSRSFRDVTVSNGDIDTLLLRSGNDLYLLAANRSSSTITNATITISGLSLSTITRVYETGSLTLTSNVITDTFSDYQVHVYKLN